MFLPSPGHELRQGDILRGLYYPEPNLEALSFEGNPSEPLAKTLALSPLIETDTRKFKWLVGRTRYLLRGHVIVLSQCCDMDLEGKRTPKAHAIMLSPLLDIPANILADPEKLDRLKLNENRFYTNNFYIPSVHPIASDSVVNFNRVFSVSSSRFAILLERKVLEMTIESRYNLKSKFAYNFSRSAGDDTHLYPNDLTQS